MYDNADNCLLTSILYLHIRIILKIKRSLDTLSIMLVVDQACPQDLALAGSP